MKALARRWFEALRSGRYQQERGYMRSRRDGHYSFCALGLLCELHDPSGWEGNCYRGQVGPPLDVREAAGLTAGLVLRVAELNDNDWASFSEIADDVEWRLNLLSKARA